MDQRDSGRLAMDVRRARWYESRLVVVLAVLGLLGVVVFAHFERGIGYDPMRPRPAAMGAAAALYLLAYLVAIGLWLAWFRVVYRAAGAAGGTRHDSVMAVVGWLVPGVWLFVPARMVDDVWRAGGDRKPLPSVVRWWWRVWGAALVIRTVDITARAFFGGRGWGPAWIDLVESVLLLLAVPFAIGTVLALTARLDRVAQSAAAPAAWPEPRDVAAATASKTT